MDRGWCDQMASGRYRRPTAPPHQSEQAGGPHADVDAVDGPAALEHGAAGELRRPGPPLGDVDAMRTQSDERGTGGLDLDADRHRLAERRCVREHDVADVDAAGTPQTVDTGRDEQDEARRQDDHDRRRAGQLGDGRATEPGDRQTDTARRDPDRTDHLVIIRSRGR